MVYRLFVSRGVRTPFPGRTRWSGRPAHADRVCVALPGPRGDDHHRRRRRRAFGGLMAAGWAPSFQSWSPGLFSFRMVVVGIVCGGLWMMLAGALRHYRGVNETISSLLLTYIAIAVLNHLLRRSVA